MMFCSGCGSKLNDDEKFCPSCGTSALENEKPFDELETEKIETEKTDVSFKDVAVNFSNVFKSIFKQFKKIDFKKLVKPVIGVVAAIVVVIVAVNTIIGGKYEERKHVVIVANNGYYYTFTLDGKERTQASFNTENGRIDSITHSFDGKSLGFIYYGESDTLRKDSGELYLYNGKKNLIRIDENVTAFQLSDDGKSVAYVHEHDDWNNDYNITLYRKEKYEFVSSKATGNLCISPDGKTVGYTELISQEPESYEEYSEAFVWNKGGSDSLGKDTEIIAVANKAKYVYYAKDGYTYAQKKLNRDNRVRFDGDVNLYFNKNMSQCFYSDGNASGIAVKGKKVHHLDGRGFPMLPATLNVKNEYYTGSRHYTRMGVSDFKNTFYNTNLTVHYIDKDYNSDEVISSDKALLGKDGKTIFYLKNSGRNGKIYKVNGKNPDAERKLIVDSDNEPEDFFVTSNGKGIYYVNDKNELYYQKGKGKSEQLGEFEYLINGLYKPLYKGKTFYWVEDNELKMGKGYGKAKTVGNFEHNIYDMYCDLDFIYVTTHDSGDFYEYISKDGKNFELIGNYHIDY